jgi:hypothetical protein
MPQSTSTSSWGFCMLWWVWFLLGFHGDPSPRLVTADILKKDKHDLDFDLALLVMKAAAGVNEQCCIQARWSRSSHFSGFSPCSGDPELIQPSGSGVCKVRLPVLYMRKGRRQYS